MSRKWLAIALAIATALPADAAVTMGARPCAAPRTIPASTLAIPAVTLRPGLSTPLLTMVSPTLSPNSAPVSLAPSVVPAAPISPAITAVAPRTAPQPALPQLQEIAERGPPDSAGKSDSVDSGRMSFDGARAAPSGSDWRRLAVAIMVASSMNLSRTVSLGRRYFASADLPHAAIQETAARNFLRCAEFVTENAAALPLSGQTAIRVNRILTEGLVPDDLLGNPNFHRDSAELFQWLNSPEAARLAASDPVAMAAEVHQRFSKSDSFTDGNGRTARILADLVLLQHGLPPAFHAGMQEYYSRASHRAKVSPEERVAYFREAAARAQAVMAAPERFSEFIPPGASPELLNSLQDAGQEGIPVEPWTKHLRQF